MGAASTTAFPIWPELDERSHRRGAPFWRRLIRADHLQQPGHCLTAAAPIRLIALIASARAIRHRLQTPNGVGTAAAERPNVG